MTQPRTADAELIRRCTEGDSEAWQVFVERFSGLVYFSVCHLLRTRGLSMPDDMVGEVHNAVFLSLLEDDFRRLRRFGGRSKLSHWIKVITVNRTIDFLRKRKPTVCFDDPEGPGPDILSRLEDRGRDPEEEAMRAERLRVLDSVLRRLSEPDRTLVRLVWIDGEPGEYVARVLGTTVGAVYTRKNRLRKRLVQLLKEGDAPEVLAVHRRLRAAKNGVGKNGAGKNGVGENGVGKNAVGENAVGKNGVGREGAVSRGAAERSAATGGAAGGGAPEGSLAPAVGTRMVARKGAAR